MIFIGILLIGFGIMDANKITQIILIIVGIKLIIITIIFRKDMKITNNF